MKNLSAPMMTFVLHLRKRKRHMVRFFYRSDDDDFEKMAMDEGIKPAPVPAPAPPPDNPYAQPVLGPALLPEVGGRRLCCLFL